MARHRQLWDASRFLIVRWRSDMSDCKQQQASAGDELDLIELAQVLWAEKILVLIFTAVTTLAALAYTFAVSPQYASQAVISPATIDTFGSLAGALGAKQRDNEIFGIKAGAQLANDAFNIFATNLRSVSGQRAFLGTFQTEGPFELSVSKGRVVTNATIAADPDPVTVSVLAGKAEIAKEAVEQYLAVTARLTTAQINHYFSELGISQRIEPGSLYRLEQPALVNSKPVKPKRALIVALGVVLGGMLGVFVALVRLMLKKRAGTN